MIPKFRAWDKVSETMHKVEGIRFGINGARVISLAEMNRYNNNHTRWHTDIELLQSIGLFDKNGTEIYEGDIVNVHAFYFDGCSESEQEHIGIMRYGNIAGFLIKQWYLETVNNKIAFSDLELHEESFEKLGNEFENKELLNYDSE